VPSQNQVEQQFLRAQAFVPVLLMQAGVERRDTTIPSPQTQRHAHAAGQTPLKSAAATILLFAELTLRSR
jgi:hypothetical protein